MLVSSRICDFSDTCNVTVFTWISCHLKADKLPEPQERRINWDRMRTVPNLCSLKFTLYFLWTLKMFHSHVLQLAVSWDSVFCYGTQILLVGHGIGKKKTWSSLLCKWKCKIKPWCKSTSLILNWQKCRVFKWMQGMSQRCSRDTRMGFITPDFRDM